MMGLQTRDLLRGSATDGGRWFTSGRDWVFVDGTPVAARWPPGA